MMAGLLSFCVGLGKKLVSMCRLLVFLLPLVCSPLQATELAPTDSGAGLEQAGSQELGSIDNPKAPMKTRVAKPTRYAKRADQPPPGFARYIERASAYTGIAFVVAFLVIFPWIIRACLVSLRDDWWLVLAISAAAIGLRLVLPSIPVMHYMGYHIAQLSFDLDPIPKYGSGALAAHHLLFKLTGPSHIASIWLNKIVGGLLVLPSAALIALLGGSRKSVIAAALLVAFVPLFVKDSTTESLGVLTAFWTICGLVLATSSNYSVATLLGMFVSLGLAVLSRPEALVLVPFGAILLAPKGENRLSTTAFALLTLATLIFVALRVAQMTWAVLLELSRGNIPQMASLGVVKTVILGTIWRNGAFWPSIFPVGVTLVALFALFVRKIRRPAAILLGLGLVWIATSQLDLPYVSVPRVQAPGLLLITLAAALGFEGLGLRTSVVAALVIIGSAIYTVPTLWARSNSDDEEDLLRKTTELLPSNSVTVVRRGYEDHPLEPAHLDWPDYWFQPPFRDDKVRDIKRFLSKPNFDKPVYFIKGIRCFYRKCGERGGHPACLELGKRFTLKPVYVKEVPLRRLPIDRNLANPLSDMDFRWCYSDDGPFEIGLFQVLPKSPSN